MEFGADGLSRLRQGYTYVTRLDMCSAAGVKCTLRIHNYFTMLPAVFAYAPRCGYGAASRNTTVYYRN